MLLHGFHLVATAAAAISLLRGQSLPGRISHNALGRTNQGLGSGARLLLLLLLGMKASLLLLLLLLLLNSSLSLLLLVFLHLSSGVPAAGAESAVSTEPNLQRG